MKAISTFGYPKNLYNAIWCNPCNSLSKRFEDEIVSSMPLLIVTGKGFKKNKRERPAVSWLHYLKIKALQVESAEELNSWF